MDEVEFDLRDMGIEIGEQELWTKQNGHLS